jgi:heme-degrading monooxygenase HmoA
MFAVIFEVLPKPGRFDDYLAIATLLRPELEKIEGFIDNERFESVRLTGACERAPSKGRILSLSTWRDEKALIRWRTLALHHEMQARGREAVFSDYHLRVGEIAADTHVPPGMQIVAQRLDATETGPAKRITLIEVTSADGAAAGAAPAELPDCKGVIEREVYASITAPGKLLLLAGRRDAEVAPTRPPEIPGATVRVRDVRIVRDYALRDRREAPQYYPPVAEER